MASFRCELTAYFDLATKFVAGLPSRSLLERREKVLKAARLRLAPAWQPRKLSGVVQNGEAITRGAF
jgi:hypothetical protein